MYCLHTPGAGHKKWQERKDEQKAEEKKRRAQRDPDPSAQGTVGSSTPSTSSTGDGSKKLALSQQLRYALVTQAGITGDHFQKIWDTTCVEPGN